MSKLISVIVFFIVVYSVYSLTESDHTCIEAFNKELNSDFLLGDWYFVYKWSFWLNYPPSASCGTITFSRPTAEEVSEYTDHYTDYSNYNITQNPLITDIRGLYQGAFVGYNEVKFFVLSPDHHMRLPNGYWAQGFRRINDEYVLYVNCNLRQREFWLLSRKRNQTLEELDEIIAGIEEVKRLETQKHCA